MTIRLIKRNIATIFLSVATLAASAQISRTVSDISDYAYPRNRASSPPSFTYASDGQSYLLLSPDARTIDRYDIASGKKIETLFDASNTREESIGHVEGFELSQDGRYLLVYTNSEYIYRRSFTAEYYVYEVRTKILNSLSQTFDRQRAPLMSPDGLMVAFVGPDNNIYIRKNVYKSEVAVTKDGELNKLINGVPDWVYEEEFSTSQSMAWAPDNLTLCYLSYNEAEVPLYTLPIYQGACNPQDQYALYPGVYSYKYPVAGKPNSVVTLHSYDVETRKIKDIELPDKKIEYIPRIAYGGQAADRLIVSTLNRDQNRFEIYSVNPKSTVARSIYVEESKAWIAPEAYEALVLLDDGFVVQSTKTGYNHLYKYTYAGALSKTLTSGDFDVTEFYGYDAKGNYYYQAAQPTPMDRTITKVDIKGVARVVSKATGTTNATFSPSLSYAMVQYSDAVTPPVYSISTPDGKEVRVLEDNAAYAKRYADAPKKEFFTFNSDGYELNGYVILPVGANGKKCPVIMSQYSGPGSQQVLNKWSIDWEAYYAKQGYAIVCVDGRGTGGRGREFMDIVYKRLGYYETIDQINAARWAASQPWADAQRIGIYGWSYGGYEALMAATATDNPYAAAVAIAPVTDWRFYDTIYAERFMLTPQQNEDGYRASAPLNRTARLSCPLLIMYGTSDDNVHPANSLQFVSMLQNQGGLCDMLVFPNMNHSIYGCNARSVVYAKMLQFFNSKLKD